jgi:hypothetical protein
MVATMGRTVTATTWEIADDSLCFVCVITAGQSAI